MEISGEKNWANRVPPFKVIRGHLNWRIVRRCLQDQDQNDKIETKTETTESKQWHLADLTSK